MPKVSGSERGFLTEGNIDDGGDEPRSSAGRAMLPNVNVMLTEALIFAQPGHLATPIPLPSHGISGERGDVRRPAAGQAHRSSVVVVFINIGASVDIVRPFGERRPTIG
jgi:hypothetical protein